MKFSADYTKHFSNQDFETFHGQVWSIHESAMKN